jgi:hypothetical protein
MHRFNAAMDAILYANPERVKAEVDAEIKASIAAGSSHLTIKVGWPTSRF